MSKIQVNYISCWDGCEDVVTNAILDLETGVLSNIGIVEVDDNYEICKGEFMQYEDGTIEEVVECYFDGKYCYKIVSKTENDFYTIVIHDTNYIVSTDLSKDDISMVLGVFE